MAASALRLIKQSAEFQPLENIKLVPPRRRGIYVLYRLRRRGGRDYYDVVYVGLATFSIRNRLRSHRRKKKTLWTHFSAFEAWENIRDEEIVELEGLLRHLYRKDRKANALNVQKRFKKAEKVVHQSLKSWSNPCLPEE